MALYNDWEMSIARAHKLIEDYAHTDGVYSTCNVASRRVPLHAFDSDVYAAVITCARVVYSFAIQVHRSADYCHDYADDSQKYEALLAEAAAAEHLSGDLVQRLTSLCFEADTYGFFQPRS